MAGRVNLPLLYLAVMVVSGVLIGSITHYIERVGSWSPVAVCLLWSVPMWAVGVAWGYRSDRRQGDAIYFYLLALAYWVIGVSHFWRFVLGIAGGDGAVFLSSHPCCVRNFGCCGPVLVRA